MIRSRARDPRIDAEWLTAALREQAGEHEADRRRIDARFERLTVQVPARRLVRLTQLRLIGVPLLGILAAVATATVAVGVTLGITARPTHVSGRAAPSSSPSVTVTATGHQPIPRTTASAPRPAGTASAYSQSGPTTAAAPTGPLTATGTIDSHSSQYWTQENLTVTTTRAIRALHVVVTVSGGSSVQSTGWWSTILAPYLTATISRTADGLRYDLTVKPGQTLQPAAYAFGFQFDRPAAGHDFTLDAYTVTATTTDDALQSSANGTFQ